MYNKVTCKVYVTILLIKFYNLDRTDIDSLDSNKTIDSHGSSECSVDGACSINSDAESFIDNSRSMCSGEISVTMQIFNITNEMCMILKYEKLKTIYYLADREPH